METKKVCWTFVMASGAALALVAAPASAQQNVTCTGQLPTGTYESVTVPKGSVCGLNAPNTTVLSNVKVESGAALSIGGATVDGSVVANHSREITIENATIDGDVHLVGSTGTNLVLGNAIGGNIQIVGKTAGIPNADAIDVDGNNIGGNVTLVNNTSTLPIFVASNMIGMNLTCVNNTPSPITLGSGGSPNTVGINKTGQCAGL
jgi:hypothetical protein